MFAVLARKISNEFMIAFDNIIPNIPDAAVRVSVSTRTAIKLMVSIPPSWQSHVASQMATSRPRNQWIEKC